MERGISVSEALELADTCLLLDVRSEGEYARAHIPGAISFPLFSDDERAEVGTIYKKQGKDKAFLKGIEMAGPKMAGFIKKVNKLNPEGKQIILHCWRGGKRSQSMAWLFGQAGMRVMVMQGGYKAYRNIVLNYFDEFRHPLYVLGGRTGSGKTQILPHLVDQGEQVIDLEGFAHHKGSAFGALGEQAQPYTEHFENLLAHQLWSMRDDVRVWVENESKSIGKVYLPQGMRTKMKETALFHYDLDLESRLDILVNGYAQYPQDELIASFERIETKLGGVAFKEAVDAVRNQDFREAARIALYYYDKTYVHNLDENSTPNVFVLPATGFRPAEVASELIAMANQFEDSGICVKK
jgi:tRNA 2-selenouridine synthase